MMIDRPKSREAYEFGRLLREKGLQLDTFFCNNVLQLGTAKSLVQLKFVQLRY